MDILDFLSGLNWIDGTPLKVEPYRLDLFRRAFSVGPNGLPVYSMVLAGRAKKNFKSADLVLAGLYTLTCRESPCRSSLRAA